MSLYLGNRDLGRTSEVGHNLAVKRVLGEGVTPDLEITQDNPTRMGVRVTGLTALIPHTNDAIYEAYQIGTDELDITNAHASNPRIDTIVFYIDRDTAPDNTVNDNPDLAVLAVVAGTPASNPSAPSESTINTAVSNNPYIEIANVRVNAGVSAITNANITILATNLSLGSDWDEADDDSPKYIDNKPDTSGTGLISNTERTKLGNLETSATRDQTGGEIRTLLEALSSSTKMTEDGLRNGTLSASKMVDALKLAVGWLTIATTIASGNITHFQSRRTIKLNFTDTFGLNIGDKISFLANDDSTRRYYGIITVLTANTIYIVYPDRTENPPAALTQLANVQASKVAFPTDFPDLSSSSWDFLVEAPLGTNVVQDVGPGAITNIKNNTNNPVPNYFMDIPIGKWDIEWAMTGLYNGAGRYVGISSNAGVISDSKLVKRYGGTSQLHGDTVSGTGYVSSTQNESGIFHAILWNPHVGTTTFTFSDRPRFYLRLRLRTK